MKTWIIRDIYVDSNYNKLTVLLTTKEWIEETKKTIEEADTFLLVMFQNDHLLSVDFNLNEHVTQSECLNQLSSIIDFIQDHKENITSLINYSIPNKLDYSFYNSSGYNWDY